MNGSLVAEAGDGVTLKGLCFGLGTAAVFFAGLILIFLQDEAPALLARAAELEREARTYLDERDTLLRQKAEAEELDGCRLALIDVGKVFLETCENVLATCDLSLADAVDTMLRAGQASMLAAIDFDRGEYWAVSIFQVQGEELERIAALRPNSLEESIAGRSWRRGEGFAGVAWQHESEVIISDCALPEVAAAYRVPPDKQRLDDQSRYKSIAVIPIRVGPADAFWGVVAVSSDRVGRFERNPGDDRVKNVDTVRLVARAIELLAAGFARGN